MDALSSLSLNVPVSLAYNLMLALERYGFFRQRVLAATKLLQASKGRSASVSADILSSLRVLEISGDFPLAALVVNRPIDRLDLFGALGYQHFNDICCLMDSSVYKACLTSLSLELDRALDSGAALYALAEILPNLVHFSVRQYGCDPMVGFNVWHPLASDLKREFPQLVFRLLAAPHQLFPVLKTLSVTRSGSRDSDEHSMMVDQMLRCLDAHTPSSSVLHSITINGSQLAVSLVSYRWFSLDSTV
jgi:hypothetical protein